MKFSYFQRKFQTRKYESIGGKHDKEVSPNLNENWKKGLFWLANKLRMGVRLSAVAKKGSDMEENCSEQSL